MTLEDLIKTIADETGYDADDITAKFKGGSLIIEIENVDEDDFDDADEDFDGGDDDTPEAVAPVAPE